MTPSLKITHIPKTLRVITLERLREAILAGHLKSGQRLVERFLCEELGVSRSVVREAIRYLEAEGLIEVLANKGPIVATITWEIAEQIYSIRCLLEKEAAYACALHTNSQTKARLKQALGNLHKAYLNTEINHLLKATSAFYEVIFLSGNRHVAWEIVQRLNGRIGRLRAMTLSTKDRHETGFVRMEKIYNAIKENNPQIASEAVEAHIEEAAGIAKKILATK